MAERKRRAGDSASPRPHRLTLATAIGAMLVAALGVVVSYLSYRIASQSYNVAQETARITLNSARALLEVASADRVPQPDAFTSEWQVTLVNQGRSLANDVKFRARAITKANPEDGRFQHVPSRFERALPDMPPGHSLTLPVLAFSYVPEEMEPQRYGALAMTFSWRDSATGTIEERTRCYSFFSRDGKLAGPVRLRLVECAAVTPIAAEDLPLRPRQLDSQRVFRRVS